MRSRFVGHVFFFFVFVVYFFFFGIALRFFFFCVSDGCFILVVCSFYVRKKEIITGENSGTFWKILCLFFFLPSAGMFVFLFLFEEVLLEYTLAVC